MAPVIMVDRRVVWRATYRANLEHGSSGGGSTHRSLVTGIRVDAGQPVTITADGDAGVAWGFASGYLVDSGEKGDGDDDDEFVRWRAQKDYRVGDVVEYAGRPFRCLRSHRSHLRWEPARTHALWSPHGMHGVVRTSATDSPLGTAGRW